VLRDIKEIWDCGIRIADCGLRNWEGIGQERNDSETRRNGDTETCPSKTYHVTSFPRRRESREMGKFNKDI
jgi:hypothetical protein